jgi:FkbM family methyltransferase
MFKKIVKKFRLYQSSYSQSGEDIIMLRLLNKLKICKASYLDIGASDPIKLNNTYLLYKSGCSGVLVEPNPVLADRIKRKRKRDNVIQAGVGISSSQKADFYVMSNPFLSTFDKKIASKQAEQDNVSIDNIIQIPLFEINDIIRKNFDNCPDVISLDIEGLDLEVLKSFAFEAYKPAVFCLETLVCCDGDEESKRTELIDLVCSHGYLAFADTYINTIFVDKKRWMKRHSH